MLVDRAKAAPVLAELLGTGVLVMVALVLSQTTAVTYFIGTSVAIALAALYGMFSGVSGAHMNPALTFGMWASRRISTVKGVAYIIAQMLGGLAAWQLFQYFTNHELPAKSIAYSTPQLVAEIVGTAILAVGLSAALNRGMDTLTSAFTYGGSFFIGVLVAGTASAAYLNPAIALGSRAWSTVYVVGPLIGALVGVFLYTYVFVPAPKTTKTSATEVVKSKLKVTRKTTSKKK